MVKTCQTNCNMLYMNYSVYVNKSNNFAQCVQYFAAAYEAVSE